MALSNSAIWALWLSGERIPDIALDYNLSCDDVENVILGIIAGEISDVATSEV